MKFKYVILLFVALLIGFVFSSKTKNNSEAHIVESDAALENSNESCTSNQELLRLYESHISNSQVYACGKIEKILPDDNKGSRHQRFIVRLSTGQTLLIAHNIDLAPRINGIAVDSAIEVYGVYEWNDKGGVVHWTHHDPRGGHVSGFIKYSGVEYK